MFRKILKAESGYSLIEVLASIVILTIAILPMVAMFDTGLRGTRTSSNYDKARALANLKMEQAKSLPFATVKGGFPVSPSTYDANGHYLYNSGDLSVSDPTIADDFPDDFEYSVEKQYMRQPDSSSVNFEECDPDSSDPKIACSPGTKLIKLTITVRWDSNITYTTYGLVTE